MRVVLAEDSVLLRAGLVRLLGEAGHVVVAERGDATDLVDVVAAEEPDLVVLDVRMPPTHTDEGVQAALAIRRHRPSQPVLVLSQYVEQTRAVDLVADTDGGVGYLLKDRVADVADFLDAVERVAGGGTAIDAQVVRQLLSHTRRDDPLAALTPRERDVLALMAEGLSNAAIADRLVVSMGAVEKHVGNILAKLGIEPDDAQHRRVRAVLVWLEETAASP